MEKIKITVTIDKKVDDIISILAKENKTAKSAIVREALELYTNNLLSNPLNEINKKLEELDNKLDNELGRYNSILAKDALYSIAVRQHLVALHSVLRSKDEAVQIAEKSWNVALDKLKN
jgi:tetrahydromethanopterin S-methyltransferase subunit G